MRTENTVGATAAYIEGASDVRIWGMSGRERGVRLTRRLGLALLEELEMPASGPHPLLLLRADSVFEERLAKELIKCPGVLLVAPSSAGLTALAACVESEQAARAMELLRKEGLTETAIREAGLKPMQAADMVGLYDAALRKRAPPCAFRLMPPNTAQIEKITFDAAYKGVTDLVTKSIFPWPTFHITRLLSQTKATPNVVTTASLVFTLLFFPFVLNGYFLAGIGCIWAMALLDTVDGKLARVTLTSTQFGRVYDHGIDLVAPPLWWFAWWLGLPEHGDSLIYWSVWIVVGGHVAGKLVEQLFISTFGIKVHIWRRFDSDFRLITARRNPNLLILTLFTVLGFPTAGYLAVAVWILFSLGVHMVRYLQALAASRNGVAITSWLAA